MTKISDHTLLAAGVILCIIAAWFSIGYHHPDEHFQIWEFANYKLGHIPAVDLPWEFHAKERPGVQVFLAYSTILVAQKLGIENPFIQVFITRLICGIVAIWIFWRWSFWLERDLKQPANARWLRIGLLFFCFIPYLNVRFTSENTSALCFFGGMLLLVRAIGDRKNNYSWHLVLAGFMLGLSFFFRYQIAFAGIGLGAWILTQNRLSWSVWAALTIGVLVAVCVGLATSFWLYGEWVFAPYNYYYHNIVLGKAAEFGVEPVWWYLTEMPIALIPPLGLALWALFFVGLWKKPMHSLTWCLVPYVVAHSFMAHKEVRFLFPMVLPFFFLVVSGWEFFQEKFEVKNWMRKSFAFCLWLNLVPLTFTVLAPACKMAAYSKFLWDWELAHPNSTIYFVKKAPRKHYPLDMPFYENPKQHQLDWYTDSLYKNDTTALKSGDLMLFTEVLNPQPTVPPGYNLKRVFAMYPNWALRFNINDWQSRTRIWAVYEVIDL